MSILLSCVISDTAKLKIMFCWLVLSKYKIFSPTVHLILVEDIELGQPAEESVVVVSGAVQCMTYSGRMGFALYQCFFFLHLI